MALEVMDLVLVVDEAEEEDMEAEMVVEVEEEAMEDMVMDEEETALLEDNKDEKEMVVRLSSAAPMEVILMEGWANWDRT
mmetsp:Transcript_66091/g.158092  ORF Transcript_66091/g.158092 Transcript_66091/m.158092 type:complete len:80 (-) Transcript_66091:1426-1665(-)